MVHHVGHPNHENVIALADRLQGFAVKYLVIDDGWAERPTDLAVLLVVCLIRLPHSLLQPIPLILLGWLPGNAEQQRDLQASTRSSRFWGWVFVAVLTFSLIWSVVVAIQEVH